MDDNKIQAILRRFEEKRPQYISYTESLRTLLISLCNTIDIRVESITARTKDSASLAEKLRRKSYDSIGDVTDISGLRIMTQYQSSIATVVKLLSSEFEVIEHIHHGADSPDEFGYASEHLLIRLTLPRSKLPEWNIYDGLIAEIQVRSILQHAWASISHSLDYKSDSEIPISARRKLFRVAAMLESADETFDSYRKEVHVIRESYRDDASTENWRFLPLNLDSLTEVWTRLPIRQVVELAEACGFNPSGGWSIDDQVLPDEDFINFEPRFLLRISQAVGVRQISEIADMMENLVDEEELLRRIAAASGDPKYVEDKESGPETIVAVAPDVIAILLVAKNPSNQAVFDAAVDEVRPHLVRAAVAVGAGRG